MMPAVAFLMNFLASAVGDIARDMGQPLALSFVAPDPVPERRYLAGLDISAVGVGMQPRACCGLGAPLSPAIDITELPSAPHIYMRSMAMGLAVPVPGDAFGKVGYVYTRRGGLIDVAHVRDVMDYTRFYATRYDFGRALLPGGETLIFNEQGDGHLVLAPKSTAPSPVVAALMGARLAYERSAWHEIATMTPGSNQNFSAFSPEDAFSNALGALAGFDALLTPRVAWDLAADQALAKYLNLLGPATKEQTQAAMDYVEGSWFKPGNFIMRDPTLLRRNFDLYPALPWLITELAVPNKVADGQALRAALGRPRSAGIPSPANVDGLAGMPGAHLEIRNIDATLLAEFPQKFQQTGIVNGSDFPEVVAALRAKNRIRDGVTSDSPGIFLP